jgi:DeoR/GlpR family transcriptional regulator of sugar metabolism
VNTLAGNNTDSESSSRKLMRVERQQYILEYLRNHKSIDVSFLTNELKVSDVTIRKDLEKLEHDGLLLRSHGGAVINDYLFLESSFIEKEDKFIEEKMAIATEAAKLIKDSMIVAMTTGTTISHMTKMIRDRNDLTVVTNAVNVATDLMNVSGINLFLTGGNIRPKTFALIGEMAEKSLEGLFYEIAFVGLNGFSIDVGLTTPSMEEAKVVRKVIEGARKVVVLADHTKFNKVTFNRFATMEQIDIVITDSKTPADQINRLRNLGITVIVA